MEGLGIYIKAISLELNRRVYAGGELKLSSLFSVWFSFSLIALTAVDALNSSPAKGVLLNRGVTQERQILIFSPI